MNRLITILFLGMTTIIMQAKTDKEQIEALYREMYEAMVAKDTAVLLPTARSTIIRQSMKRWTSP